MKTSRLAAGHPVVRRIEDFFAHMEEQGMGFEFDPDGTLYVLVDGKRFRLRDIEHRAFGGSGIPELPPATEYAVLVDKE